MMDLEVWAAGMLRDRVPFKPRGRDRSGIDCWGVVWLGFKEALGVAIPSYTEDYEEADLYRFDDLANLIASHRHEWRMLKDGERAKPGDVVLMKLRGRNIHVGLVVNKDKMLHIEEGVDLCVERFTDSYWRQRVVSVYRHPSRD